MGFVQVFNNDDYLCNSLYVDVVVLFTKTEVFMSRSKQLRFTASKIDRTLRYYQTKAFKKIAARQCALNRVRNEREK